MSDPTKPERDAYQNLPFSGCWRYLPQFLLFFLIGKSRVDKIASLPQQKNLPFRHQSAKLLQLPV